MRIEIEITKTKSKIMYFNFLVGERKEAEKNDQWLQIAIICCHVLHHEEEDVVMLPMTQ
jgi:hypothetical protein